MPHRRRSRRDSTDLGPTFHKLTQLPPELRNMIWEWACWVPRVANLYGRTKKTKILTQVDDNDEEGFFTFPVFNFLADSRMPTIMLVCREAYQVSSHIYNRVVVTWDDWRVDIRRPPMFFNIHSDTLYLTTNYKRCPWGVRAFYNAVRSINRDEQLLNAEHLAISIDFHHEASLEELIADTQKTFRKARTVAIIVGEWDFEYKYLSCVGKSRPDLELVDLDNVLRALAICEDSRCHGVKQFKKALSKYSLGLDQEKIHEILRETQRVEELAYQHFEGAMSAVVFMELPNVSLKVAVTPQLKRRLKWIQDRHGRRNKKQEGQLSR